MFSTTLARCATLVLVLTFGAIACSSGDQISGPTPRDPTPTNPTNPTPNNPNPTPSTALGASDSLALANIMRQMLSTDVASLQNLRSAALPGVNPPTGCKPTVSSTADANRNGIPDDATITFTAQNCSLQQGMTRGSVTGSVRIQDLGGLLGEKVTYSKLQVTATIADSTLTVTFDGGLELLWESSTRAHATNSSTVMFELRTRSSAVTMALALNTMLQFTTDGQPITIGSAFPSGSVAYSGTMNATATASGTAIPTGGPASGSFDLSISTAAPLHFVPSCSGVPFNGGELRAQVSGSKRGTVAAAFTFCDRGTKS